MSELDTDSVAVDERKFNATATYGVVTDDKELAKAAARMYYRDHYGHRPTSVVAEYKPAIECYRVNVSDHSSGSLQDSAVYDL